MDQRIPRLLGPNNVGRRLVDLLGPTGDAARQSLVALAFNSATSLIAGAMLGAMVGTFEDLPGLLIMVPAAIGLRGNIFGTFGNRISTSVHTGTFVAKIRPETVLGQNVIASMALTLMMSVGLAFVARLAAVAFGVENAINVLELTIVSVVGGVLASAVVLAASVALSVVAVRRDWDLDNLVAPTVSTLGDVVTIPALVLATVLVSGGRWVEPLGLALLGLSAVVTVAALRTHIGEIRRIVAESVPVLSAALLLSTMAGLVAEKRLTLLAAVPALLVLMPAFVSSAGSLGGILSSRVSTNLHLGLADATMRPGREVRRDALLVLLIGLPIYVFNAIGAQALATLLGQRSPGMVAMLFTSMVGGLFTVLFVIALAYYGTVAAWRVNLDPDTVGLPLVTASVDFVGVAILVTVVVGFGIA